MLYLKRYLKLYSVFLITENLSKMLNNLESLPPENEHIPLYIKVDTNLCKIDKILIKSKYIVKLKMYCN